MLLVSNTQLSDSVIYTFFQILFHYRLLQDTEHNSLYYTVGPYLSIIYSSVYANTKTIV